VSAQVVTSSALEQCPSVSQRSRHERRGAWREMCLVTTNFISQQLQHTDSEPLCYRTAEQVGKTFWREAAHPHCKNLLTLRADCTK